MGKEGHGEAGRERKRTKGSFALLIFLTHNDKKIFKDIFGI